MKIADIIGELEFFAAPELQEAYDNSGLITGNSSWACTGALCALDVTSAVMEEAVKTKCNLIIAHHPIVFRGLIRITGSSYVEQVIISAIKNDIAIYAIHTNLDNLLLGVNGRIARKLGLTNTSILQPKCKMLRRLITFAPNDKADTVRQAIFAAGAGHIGKYEECSFNSEGTGTFKAGEGADPYVGEIGKQHMEKETKIEIVYPFYLEQQVVEALVKHHPYEEVAYDIFTMDNTHLGIGAGVIGDLEHPMEEKAFLRFVKETFMTEVIRHTTLRTKPVKRVAVCGGSGAFLIGRALKMKADCYITSDVKYHEFFDSENRMIIADIGHYESEQFTIELIHERLAKKFTTFAILKTSENTNPVRYFL